MNFGTRSGWWASQWSWSSPGFHKLCPTMTKFLLFGIVLFFGALLVYTFKILAISSLIYLCLIPVSYIHYRNIKKKKNIITNKNEEELEDIL